ncbi:hypothetical protein ACSBR1_039355 [Camellia fascicularis]
MMLLPHGAGEGGGIHEGGGRGDEGMDRDGYQDLETKIKSWQPEDRNSGVFCSYAADNLDLIPKCPRAKWELKDEIKCVVGKVFNRSRIDTLLVQYWAPIITDGQVVLTTQNQPFALSKIYKRLCRYRMISKHYEFYVDGETTEQQLGLPGRVFKHQLVESSPNVEYYSNKEYPQLEHALSCQIRAALALPVFEPADHTCVGVLELLFITRDAFLIFFEEGCAYDAFLGLDLKCLNLWEHPFMEDKNEATLRDEILDVLKLVLDVHVLPLAQIWRTCRVCRSLFNNGVFGLSRMSGLSYLMEENGDIFLRACGHHHLRKGMGVVGTALKSLNLVFCADVTQFSITEYPMTHYAREFGLSGCGCFSVCLRSSNPGNDIYVLEFFLPVSNKVGGNVMTSLMKEILGTMKKKIQSFKLASGEELGEELIVEVISFKYGEKKIRTLKLSSGEELGEEFSEVTDFHNGEKLNSVQNGADLMELESSDQQSMDAVNNESNVISAERSNSTCSQGKGTRKKLKRKQNKTGGKGEVFLEDILQTSQMRMEDAAKSLHVSVSTLKRACRKFGIPRWSPHHINQLNKNGGNSVQISPTTGSLPRLEPLQKEGDMMQLNSSDQQSMDAINITNVVGAEQSNIAVTCSQEKYAIKRSERERIKTGIRIEIPLEDILQASEMSLNDAANSLHVSKSTLKRACRDYGFQKWPPSKITKFSVGSLPRLEPLQNEGDMMQHQQSMDAINIGAEQSNIAVTCSQEKYAIKRSEREHKNKGVRNAIHIEDILQASEMRIQDAANSLHVSISTLKRACRKLGISRWPPRLINKINKNGGSSVQISPTTGSLPRSEPLKNEGDMMQLDSLDQQSRDATKNGGDVICSQEKGTMKMPYREDKKTGVRIAMPSEHILQTSKESLEGAAEHHSASQSAFKSAGSPYFIQRWPTGLRRKITRSLPRPGPLQNGDDQMMQLDSSDQQSMDALNIMNVVGAEQSNIAVTCSHEKDAIKRSEREHKKTGVKFAIPIEDILQASEMSLNDAACRLNVSKSTLKRIEKWPPSKRTKFSCSQPFDEKQIQKLDPDLSSNQAGNIVTLTKPHDTATKDAEIVTIKAKYGNDVVIKFRLSSSSGLVELRQEVARRLNLDPGTYHIKYKDEDGDLILIACDDDLLDFITISRTLGNTTILLLLEPRLPIT